MKLMNPGPHLLCMTDQGALIINFENYFFVICRWGSDTWEYCCSSEFNYNTSEANRRYLTIALKYLTYFLSIYNEDIIFWWPRILTMAGELIYKKSLPIILQRNSPSE